MSNRDDNEEPAIYIAGSSPGYRSVSAGPALTCFRLIKEALRRRLKPLKNHLQPVSQAAAQRSCGDSL